MLKNKLVIITLWVLFLLFSILYNILNIKSSNYPLIWNEWLLYEWIKNNSYFNAQNKINFDFKNLIENNNLNKWIFINWWYFLVWDKLESRVLLWMSLILSPIKEVIKFNYHYHVYFFWIIWLIFVYLTIILLTKNLKIWVLWVSFYAFSYVFFQYYMILSDSITALTFFIIWYYLILQYVINKKNSKYLFFSFFFIWISIVIRLDFILILPLILLLFINQKIVFIKKLLLLIPIILSILLTSFISNNIRYWNPLSIWYENEWKYINNEISNTSDTKLYLSKIISISNRFFSNFNNIEKAKERFIENQKFLFFIINIWFIFIIFIFLGRNNNTSAYKKIFLYQFTYIILIYIYISTMYFTDMWTDWIMSVHSRYLLPYYYIIILYSISFWLIHVYKNYRYLLILSIIVHIVLFYGNFYKNLWVYNLISRKINVNSFFESISLLPKNAFVFSTYDVSNTINKFSNINVIYLDDLYNRNITDTEILKAIDVLLNNNYPIYLFINQNLNNNNTNFINIIYNKYEIYYVEKDIIQIIN